jgi:pimeloyl-ACP methyl ester carboxylesterase
VSHAMDCLAAPENVAAAIGYYRAMLDPSRHVARYAAEQEALLPRPTSPDRPPGGRLAGQPHLYLHGASDGCLGVDQVKGADQHLPPGSRVEIVDDTGHFLHLEKPAVVNRLILDWLGGRAGQV